MRKLAAASAAGDAAAGAAAEAAYAVCVSADVQKASAYQPVGPLPACLSLAAVHGTMANYVQIALAHLFCDGAAVVHGQYHVPPDPASATRSAALAKLVAKFATRHVHCAISYTHRLVKAGGDAAIADLARAAYDRCYAVARFASEQAVLRLDAGSSPPPCQSESSLLGEQVDVQAKVLAIAFCAP